MSIVQLLLAAEAAARNRAVQRTAFRHRHIAERPFVVVAYNLSGEAAAPLGFCYGRSPRDGRITIAHEPRNRESRFSAINTFAADFVEYVRPFLELREQEAGRGSYVLRVADDAPQIVVPNRATRDYLGARLGRSLRYLGLGDTYKVPEATQWAGAHLSWLADHALHPGQSIFVAATELLNRHFVTGQSDFENENLASLLAWIDNDVESGRGKIDGAEDAAYGPVPDPTWEVALEPLVRDWTRCDRDQNVSGKTAAARKIESLVSPKLQEAYAAIWRALDRMAAVPVTRSVSDRWDADKRAWGSHARRAERGIPRFAKRHDALRAAQTLEAWSRALEQLEFDEAIDDPLVLAEVDAAGRCVCGQVQKVDLNHREVKRGNKLATQVPLVELNLAGPSNLLVGDSVIWTTETAVQAQVRLIDDRTATLAITAGHKSGTRIPASGQTAVFAALSAFGGKSPESPRHVPWTHRPPELASSADSGSAGGDLGRTDASSDGTPDLSPEQLLDLPVVGGIAPDDVPGVVV